MKQLTKKELNIFSKNLKFLINTSGYKTSYIAKKIGVDSRAIQRWKINDNMPSLQNGFNLMRLFDKSVEDLLNNKYYRN